MYEHTFELPVDVRNCYDEADQAEFLKAYNSLGPKTPEEHEKALREAFKACAELPSSFSFHAIASVDAIDRDREKVDVDSIKKHMDEFLAYGGNVNWEHKDLVTGRIWAWAPAMVKGRPGVQIWGNLYGGRPIYDEVRKDFVAGKNSFSLGGQARPTGYKCDKDGCYIQREVDALYEISVVARPANPYATTLDYSKGEFRKSVSDGIGVDLIIQEYTIHRDYTNCPIMKVKRQLEDDGYVGCHATKEGVVVPMAMSDSALRRLTGGQGLVLSKCEGGTLVQDREWVLEKAFGDLYGRGAIMPDGTLVGDVAKGEFESLYRKGLLSVDDRGTARMDTPLIYQ